MAGRKRALGFLHALQFHLETTEESLLKLYENAEDEIIDAPFIQTLEEMRPFFPTLGNANALMNDLPGSLFCEESPLTNNE